LADPEPWDRSVDGPIVGEALLATLRKFVVLPAHAAIAIVLWLLHAHALAAFQISPLLVVTSPVRRCGKSTLLHILSALLPRSLMTSNISQSALYRTVEQHRPSLLIDEADSFMKMNDELRGLLNSGHTRAGAVVIRAVGDNFEPRAFTTWGAKVVALIGNL